VDRNCLGLAVVAATMLDEAEERSTGYFATREERAARAGEEADLRQQWKLGRPQQPLPATASATADALYAALDTARVINPRWWGQERRRGYEVLLRFYRAQETARAKRKLATCYYYLQMFEAWETELAAAEETAPRAVEKALRWSGNTDTYARENYDLVRRFVTGGGTGPTSRPK